MWHLRLRLAVGWLGTILRFYWFYGGYAGADSRLKIWKNSKNLNPDSSTNWNYEYTEIAAKSNMNRYLLRSGNWIRIRNARYTCLRVHCLPVTLYFKIDAFRVYTEKKGQKFPEWPCMFQLTILGSSVICIFSVGDVKTQLTFIYFEICRL